MIQITRMIPQTPPKQVGNTGHQIATFGFTSPELIANRVSLVRGHGGHVMAYLMQTKNVKFNHSSAFHEKIVKAAVAEFLAVQAGEPHPDDSRSDDGSR
ncbi:hypothetical protein [Mesorhizobium sp. f-mel]